MSCNNKDNTISFDEKVKGWTSFHSFLPDYMIGMNNKFFSFKDGELYIHNSNNVPRNTYYGQQYPSKLSLMVNDSPSDIKELQAVSLEGNLSWNALISAYIGMTDDFIRSSISEVEFVRKEGIWYAYARRNEDATHVDSKSTYGIGVIVSVSPTQIVVDGYSSSITAGDIIVKGDGLVASGEITDSTQDSNITTITMTNTTGLSAGDFIIGMKNTRYEGGNLRGYTMRMDLDIQKDTKVELFAVNSEVMKSFS
jgi:hypothetical protein